MANFPGSSGPKPRLNFWLLVALLVLVFLFGGASRSDALSQPILRILSVLALAVWTVQLRLAQLKAAKAPWLFLAAAAAIILLQLIPLPPGLWAALPGHAIFVEGMTMAGIEPGWRALSLTPDRTLDSLLSLLPPAAVIAGLSLLGRDRHAGLIMLLLALILLSLLFAIAQIATGSLYLYTVTNEGSAVGLFANRNHQALLLALAFPMLGYAMMRADGSRERRRARRWLAGMFMVLIAPLILVTGSRAGILLGLAGGLLALAIAFWRRPASGERMDRASLATILGSVVLSFAALAATIFAARDLALNRLVAEWGEEESRAQNIGDYIRMATDFMPFGSGAGSFDPLYRIYEPAAALRPTYLNQAHNDLAQLAIEFGLPGLALLAVFLIWWALRSWRLWSRRDGHAIVGRIGSALILLILVASLGDYPLRTPIHAVLFMIALFFMQRPPSVAPDARLEPADASSKARDKHQEVQTANMKAQS